MTPKKSPSRDELTAEKIKLVRDLIASCVRHSDIKILFRNKFGGDTRGAERWILLAYQEMRAEQDSSTEDSKAIAIERYEMIARSGKTITRDKLKALERIDKIKGNEAAVKIESSGGLNVTQTPVLSPAEERAAVEAVLKGAGDAATATGD